MGADLYIEPFFSENRDKYKAQFEAAVKERDAYIVPKEVEEILSTEKWSPERITPEQTRVKTEVYPTEYQRAKELGNKAHELYEKMYGVGYFRDSYNCSSLFWGLGLSWWGMAGNDDRTERFINDKGEIRVADAERLLALVKSLPMQVTEKDVEGWEADTTVAGLRKYFETKKKRFEEFLQFAIDNKAKIRASV